MIIILHQKKWEIGSFGALIDIHVNSEFPLSFVQMKDILLRCYLIIYLCFK